MPKESNLLAVGDAKDKPENVIVSANADESEVGGRIMPERREQAVSNFEATVEKKEALTGLKRAKAKSYYEAEPVIGKKIFDDFAKESIDKRGLRQSKPQEVTIEFSIDKNGNLSDFHHIFTGCPECGAYAISLLQNSGVWKTIPPGFAGRARYTFNF